VNPPESGVGVEADEAVKQRGGLGVDGGALVFDRSIVVQSGPWNMNERPRAPPGWTVNEIPSTRSVIENRNSVLPLATVHGAQRHPPPPAGDPGADGKEHGLSSATTTAAVNLQRRN